MSTARYPDCTNCEAPCCRRQFMEEGDRWLPLHDIRPIYRDAGTDVRIVGWEKQPDGRQPMIECAAFDVAHLRCGIYASRPEHCRTYDCREDDPDDWRARPHCDIARHRRMEASRARAKRR
ncbi:MAG TPA: YkgJ family cysteine cluster protein [Candidatus Limnocylindria bacterium]